MTVLLDYLCDYFKCNPNELNARLKASEYAVENLDDHALFSQYSFFSFIHYSGFTHEAANVIRPYATNDTLEDYFNNKYNVKLKYPDLVCLWEHIDENIHRYYPLELVEIQLF